MVKLFSLSQKRRMNELNNLNVWVVIAAFNEELVIRQTIFDLKEHLDHIVVVDDCSSDGTASIAMQLGVHVLRHPINLGQGAAIQTGIDFAIQNHANYIVTFDADGQHNPAEILPMIMMVHEKGVEVGIGSRFMGEAKNISYERKLLLKLALWYTRFFNPGLDITDVHNGFRVLSSNFCKQFRFQQNRMAHASEILSHLSKSRTAFIEYPVTITYTDYSVAKGQRGINAVRIMMELAMKCLTK